MRSAWSPQRRLLVTGIAALMLSACSNGVPEAPTGSTPCPAWPNYPTDDHSNGRSPFLGCANAVNLRDMVETPTDLDHGRTLGPANGEREAHAVRAYEQGQIKDFPNVNGPRTFSMPGATTGGSQ